MQEQKRQKRTPDDTPHGEDGGTRTPAGTTYGDFHPTHRHDRGDEPYEDNDPGAAPPDPTTIRHPSTTRR